MPNAKPTALMTTLLMLSLWLGGLPQSTYAALLDITVTGTVDQVTNPVLASQFNTSQTMSATITYDTSTAGTSGLAPVYLTTFNFAIKGGSFSIDGYEGTIPTGLIRVRDDDPTLGDAVQWIGAAEADPVGTQEAERFGLLFDDPTGAAIDNFALPLTLQDLEDFTDRRWGLSFGGVLGEGTPIGVAGPLASVTITEQPAPAVPMTSTLPLMAIGLAGMGQLRRRNRPG